MSIKNSICKLWAKESDLENGSNLPKDRVQETNTEHRKRDRVGILSQIEFIFRDKFIEGG